MKNFWRLVCVVALAVVLPLLMVATMWTRLNFQVPEDASLPRLDSWVHDQDRMDDQNRIAILIAGTLQRFNVQTLERLVVPLHRDNWTVDLYLSVQLGQVQGWKDAADAFEPEPELVNLSHEGIEALFTRQVGQWGGTVIYQRIFEKIDLTPEDLDFIEKSNFWRFGEDCFRCRVARRNFLQLWKELQNLWYYAQAQEHLWGTYSYVMILREDAYWFQDFHIKKLLQIGGRKRVSGANGNLYSLRCESGYMRGGDLEGLIDYVFLLDRRAAQTLCNAYTHMTRPAYHGKSWFESVRQEFHKNAISSEQWYLQLVKHFSVTVTEIPMYLMPMQRVARLKGQLCLHKYCDAKMGEKNIPYFQPNLPLCRE